MLFEEDKMQHDAMEFDQAIKYVNKVKAKDKHVYEVFLHILSMYQGRTKTINEVFQELVSLFENHSDLLEGFMSFLPDLNIPSSHAIAKSALQPQEPQVSGENEKHVSEQHTIVTEKEQSQHCEFEQQAKKARNVVVEKTKKKNLRPLTRVSARHASDAIRRQSQAGEGGEGFPSVAPQVSAVEGAQYSFFDKVKARLCNQEITYPEFLKCLNAFSQEIINREELQDLVGAILGKHADLLDGFNEFLTHCENVAVQVPLARTCMGDSSASMRTLGDFAVDGALLDIMMTETDHGGRDKNRARDRERRAAPKGKFANKPISMLDLSNCNRCTPSYRLLPKKYSRLVSQHRTAIGKSVLNDNWVSVTSGSEDYSVKHIRKNLYEERLFRCEDDRYELDMLRERAAAAAKAVSQYVLTEQGGENAKAVEEFLSPIHLRCIEQVYEDHGLEFLESLKQSAPRVMPVILSRLVQKTEEWTKWGEKMNKVWSNVFTMNVHKALDYQSFKQQDKKVL